MEIDSPNPQHTSLVDKIVVPGDVVLDLSKMSNQTIKLGSGLRRECDTLAAMEAGKFRFLKPNNYWIEGSHKRYIPCVEDTILGIVVDSKPDNFLVDIKGPSLAFLPVLAFEGGTRRNIPKFEVGTLLYVRVVKANSGMNPELACTDGAMMPRKQKKMQLSGNKRSADPSLGGTTSGQASISKRPAQMTRSSQPATSSNFVVCNYCHKSGHIRKECRKRQGKCLRCGLKDHMLSTCPSNRGRPAGSSEGQRQAISMTTDEAEASRHIISGTILVASISKHPTQTTRSSRLATSSNSVVCNYCRKSGHIRKECRKRQGLCLRCGLKDHMLSTCPSNRGRLARSSEGRRQAVSKTTNEAEASGHIISASGKAAEFGPLKGGYMFETSTGLSRMLLSSPTCPVLAALRKKLSFEIAVGLNGRVWVNASSSSTVILVSNAIMSSEFLSGEQQRIMVDKLLQIVEL